MDASNAGYQITNTSPNWKPLRSTFSQTLRPGFMKRKLNVRKITSADQKNSELASLSICHRYITSRFKMSISADVHPLGDISLLTAPPPTTSGVKSY
jgi:hypothetical protein